MEFVKCLKTRVQFCAIENCKEDILAFNPDVVILVDYPGFNLRIAEFLKKKIARCFTTLSGLGMGKQSCTCEIKRDVDGLNVVILPFRKRFLLKSSVLIFVFAGHPLLDEIVKIKINRQAHCRS